MATYPQDGIVAANGMQLHYRDWGGPTQAVAGATPVPLILLHGLASATRIWDLVAPELARERRVVAFDQRGHGLSQKPDAGYDFPTIVADDIAAIRALGIGERYIIAGHSWGASVTLELAASQRERVAGVILVDGGLAMMRQRTDATWETISRELAPPDYAGTPRETYLGWMRNSIPNWRPELEDIALNIVELRADDTVGPRLAFAHHMAILRSLWDEDLDKVYAAIHCPCLFILAEAMRRDGQRMAEKRQALADAQRMLASSPRVEAEWWANTIHDIPLQRPEELATRMVAFCRTIN
ncbi:MAG TPA: alpha/beta hydrolase [Ktedonobacterales bacterium]|nr:alpha/beta hydrolase [Ktedonobacterales bacterium]